MNVKEDSQAEKPNGREAPEDDGVKDEGDNTKEKVEEELKRPVTAP